MVSAVPVAPRDQQGALDRYVVHPLLHRFFGPSYDDLARMEHDLVVADDVDWTVLRPPQLTDGPPSDRYRTAVDTRLPGARRVLRADLAAAMLASLANPATMRHTITVAS